MNKESNFDILDIDELKKDLEGDDSFYKEATSDIDLNGTMAELSVSISRDMDDPELIRIRVVGNIPIPIPGGDSIVARLDRETVMDKEAFMNLDAEGLRNKVQDTVFHGKDLSKEEVEKRNTEKSFSLFSEIGAKFDDLLVNSKEAAGKYFESAKSTISTAKKNLESTKLGQGFAKTADKFKNGVQNIANVGKAIADSHDRANKAFDLAMEQQEKYNEMVGDVKDSLRDRENELAQMRLEVNAISKSLEKMTAGVAKQGFFTAEQKTKFDLMNEMLKEKTNECTYLEGSILLAEMTLERLKEVGIEYASPVSAAFKAQRESYFKDMSSAYGSIKQAVRAEFEVGKKALSNMVDTIKEANNKSKIHGKNAYINLGEKLSSIGVAGLSMMQAMEVKTADFIRSNVISLSEKYQHRSEVRASAKNLLNTILYKDADAKPLLTERESGMIATLADFADKLEAISDRTADKVVEANKKIEQKEAKPAWEPKKTSEDKKVETNKIREELDR